MTLDSEEPGEGGEVTLRSWASYRPVAVFNAADLEGKALPSLIEARKTAEGVETEPEPEHLEAAEAVLSAWPVPVIYFWGGIRRPDGNSLAGHDGGEVAAPVRDSASHQSAQIFHCDSSLAAKQWLPERFHPPRPVEAVPSGH